MMLARGGVKYSCPRTPFARGCQAVPERLIPTFQEEAKERGMEALDFFDTKTECDTKTRCGRGSVAPLTRDIQRNISSYLSQGDLEPWAPLPGRSRLGPFRGQAYEEGEVPNYRVSGLTAMFPELKQSYQDRLDVLQSDLSMTPETNPWSKRVAPTSKLMEQRRYQYWLPLLMQYNENQFTPFDDDSEVHSGHFDTLDDYYAYLLDQHELKRQHELDQSQLHDDKMKRIIRLTERMPSQMVNQIPESVKRNVLQSLLRSVDYNPFDSQESIDLIYLMIRSGWITTVDLAQLLLNALINVVITDFKIHEVAIKLWNFAVDSNTKLYSSPLLLKKILSNLTENQFNCRASLEELDIVYSLISKLGTIGDGVGSEPLRHEIRQMMTKLDNRMRVERFIDNISSKTEADWKELNDLVASDTDAGVYLTDKFANGHPALRELTDANYKAIDRNIAIQINTFHPTQYCWREVDFPRALYELHSRGYNEAVDAFVRRKDDPEVELLRSKFNYVCPIPKSQREQFASLCDRVGL